MYICGVLSPKNYTIYTRVDASKAFAFQARALSGSEGWAGHFGALRVYGLRFEFVGLSVLRFRVSWCRD